MRFRFNSTTLDQIIGGTLTAGLVPWVRSARYAESGQNAGVVTALSGDTTVMIGTSHNVLTNDLIVVCGSVIGTKGGVIGDTTLVWKKNAGTAGIQWVNSRVDARDARVNTPVAAVATQVLTAIGYVSSGGTLTLELACSSFGSNLTIAAGDAQVYILVLAGS